MSSPLPENDRVASYFDRHAVDFDTIYRTDSKPLRRLRDRLTRKTVLRRIEFVDAFSQRHRPSSVLDVGCGSARFALPLAQRGAKVVGLDFASDMLTLARKIVSEAGVAESCTFIEADFLEWETTEKFDLVLAIGVLDYVSAPDALLAKLATVCSGHLVVSFPRRLHALVPLRLLRLRLSRCPVYFYGRKQVEQYGEKHTGRFEVKSFGRDFLLVGST